MRSLLSWLILSLIAVAVLSWAAAFVPPPAKRLVLLHAVYGLGGGFLLEWLARERGLTGRWRRALAGGGGLILIAGGVNMALISSEQLTRTRGELARANPDQVAALNMLEKFSESDPEMAARYEAERRIYAPTFADYLAHRVSGAGSWPAPWPALFWGGELLLAGIAGGWVIQRGLRTGEGSPE